MYARISRFEGISVTPELATQIGGARTAIEHYQGSATGPRRTAT
jgi:hypothetical protein